MRRRKKSGSRPRQRDGVNIVNPTLMIRTSAIVRTDQKNGVSTAGIALMIRIAATESSPEHKFVKDANKVDTRRRPAEQGVDCAMPPNTYLPSARHTQIRFRDKKTANIVKSSI